MTAFAPTSGPVGRLRPLNIEAGALHLLQGLAMLVLSTSMSLPVPPPSAPGPPGRPLTPPVLDELFAYPPRPCRRPLPVPVRRIPLPRRFARGAGPATCGSWAHRNRFRWVEYSLSASLMIVLIAGITGVTDVVALLALFGVNASMILFGWLMETTTIRATGVDWTPFGSAASPAPCPGSASASTWSAAVSDVPDFVYGIYVSIFVFFNCFAVNQWLQYRRDGRWGDYLFGERVYIVLSLVAKSPWPGRSSPTCWSEQRPSPSGQREDGPGRRCRRRRRRAGRRTSAGCARRRGGRRSGRRRATPATAATREGHGDAPSRCWWWPSRAARATAELMAMTSSDVPMAWGIGSFRARARAGTITNPPPTPNSPVRKPDRRCPRRARSTTVRASSRGRVSSAAGRPSRRPSGAPAARRPWCRWGSR